MLFKETWTASSSGFNMPMVPPSWEMVKTPISASNVLVALSFPENTDDFYLQHPRVDQLPSSSRYE